MLSTLLLLFVSIFIIIPVLWAIADESIRRSNKKVEDYYNKREEEIQADYKEMYTAEDIDNDDEEN